MTTASEHDPDRTPPGGLDRAPEQDAPPADGEPREGGGLEGEDVAARADDSIAPLVNNTGDDDDGAPTG